MKENWSKNFEFGLRKGLKLPRILLCTVGELAGGRSVAVAVGVSDM